MTVWAWVGLVVSALLALSLAVAFATARVFGAIGEEVMELLDEGAWTSAPLARALEASSVIPDRGHAVSDSLGAEAPAVDNA